MNGCGLQIFDSGGRKILTLDTKVIKVLGEFYAEYGQTQYIQDDRIVGKNIAFFYESATVIKNGTNTANVFPNKIYINGNKICWEFLGGPDWSSRVNVPQSDAVYRCKFVYGWH